MNTAFIVKRMAERKLTVEEFAKRCLVAEKYMEQVLKGLRPSKRLIALMAKELECDPTEIHPEGIKQAV